jgi:hypothetical protein
MVAKIRLGSAILDGCVKDMQLFINKWGGTRTLRVGKPDMVWTGKIHLFAHDSHVDCQVSDISSIETRSSHDEDDEEWVTAYVGDQPWSYERDKAVADVLIGLGVAETERD